MNTSVRKWILIGVILCLQLGGFGLFARGFFPKKLVLPGEGVFFSDENGMLSVDELEPRFDKLILVVIDALRSDFIFSSGRSAMSEVHRLIRDGAGFPFTAHSTPPTVTLPRIKGLTTGSTPNFLDAILNIAESDTSSTLANQDSWVNQIQKQGKRLHMFGDDTWIKLFPRAFEKFDGTASFFVSDYTEVDNNVTRHIDYELGPGRESWDTLILHYLGLDHIGHKGGPDSVFMPEKQREMDHIIHKLYENMEENTLLVVTGDHGMNEAGNHGGSSSGETSAGMVFLSPKFVQIKNSSQEGNNGHKAPLDNPTEGEFTYYSRIQQTDLVPTLASLLKFPIPRNSLGVVIPDILELWENGEKAIILEQNVKQFVHVMASTYPGFDKIDVDIEMKCQAAQDSVELGEVDELRCLWWRLKSGGREIYGDKDLVFEFLYGCQDLLSKAASNYVERDLQFGLGLVILSAIVAISAVFLLKFSANLKIVLIIIAGVFSASMFGSSLVEEEHHFWYWGATGWLSWLYITSSRRKFRDGGNWIACLMLIRIIRGWNQTGQKYAGGPDTAKWLGQDSLGDNMGMESGAGQVLWGLVLVQYASLLGKLWLGGFSDVSSLAGFVFSFCIAMSSLVFKINMAIQSGEFVPKYLQFIVVSADDSEGLINLARLSFFTIGLASLYELSKLILAPRDNRVAVSSSLTNLSYIFEAFLVTQTRTVNIPLFIFFHLLRTYLARAYLINHRSSRDIVIIITIFTLILQHVSFFAMGNSNSLASIDLSNAYNGISSYQIVLVGVLTFVNNWVGPLYWTVAGLTMLIDSGIIPQTTTKAQIISNKILISQMFFSIATAGILGACYVLKHHLFIWTVFSPKLLYSAAWLILQHGLIDIMASTALAYLF
ncbi:Las21p [Sugiyamaella lignohabitans]|uniref:GPI ethanolamine phosphate transferase 2 n=1 Tax=Sugiyamaella lignohabitans TaxID=796027 RepID=A0A167EB56_9ASCO|nr:Las21p [Sugiyamaella lignohabitans]ANB13858.1 Las21p [Sugiyamaella lignohabitans]